MAIITSLTLLTACQIPYTEQQDAEIKTFPKVYAENVFQQKRVWLWQASEHYRPKLNSPVESIFIFQEDGSVTTYQIDPQPLKVLLKQVDIADVSATEKYAQQQSEVYFATEKQQCISNLDDMIEKDISYLADLQADLTLTPNSTPAAEISKTQADIDILLTERENVSQVTYVAPKPYRFTLTDETDSSTAIPSGSLAIQYRDISCGLERFFSYSDTVRTIHLTEVLGMLKYQNKYFSGYSTLYTSTGAEQFNFVLQRPK